MNSISGSAKGEGLRFAVIVSRWNDLVTNALRDGAVEVLSAAGAEVTAYSVSGAWEIAPVAAKLARSGKVDGIVAVGCILQGATTHAALLSGDISSALMRLQTETGVPIGWGILTPENTEQALDRAGMKLGNKGREAAQATLETVNLLRAL